MATVLSTKAEQIHCALHLHYTSCKYDDLFRNVWKSKMTERELEEGKKPQNKTKLKPQSPPKNAWVESGGNNFVQVRYCL